MGIKTFKKQKLRNKLLIIYIVGFFLPMLIVNILFSYNLYLEDRLFDIKNLENQVSKASILIKNEFNDALQIIYSVYINKDLADFIKGDYTSQNEYLKKRNQVFKTNSLLGQFSTYRIDYTIYTKNDKFRPDPVIRKINQTVESSLWYREFIKSDKTGYLYYTSNNPEYISIIRTLDYRVQKDKKWDNILKVDIPVSKILLHLKKIPDNLGVSLISGKYETIYTTQREKKREYIYTQHLTGIKMLSEWSIKGWLYKKSFITYLISHGRYKIIIPIFLTLILGSILIFKLFKSFYKRIYLLSEKMISIKLGNFEPIKLEDDQGDEITELSNSYNIMINQIDKLINEVSEAKLRENSIELAKNKAQLDALISQINPHYLFNVLESIRMKSVIKGEKETADIIKHLSRSFRHTISWNDNMISLGEELEISRDFLKVQKYRFGDKLNYVFNVHDSILDLLIPRLSLQPFIENSCIHGIENSSKNGTIIVEVSIKNDFLIATIKDDGIGIKEEDLNKLKLEMSHFKLQNEHIGFSNTYWRLKKLYIDFVLEIDSVTGEGTTVKLYLPIIIRGD